MMIEYMGHSCVRLKDFQDTGYKVLIDPYQKGAVPGYLDLEDEGRANMVLYSHEHRDHFGEDNITVEFYDGDCPFDIEYIDCWHDPEYGVLRGKNRIHIVTLKATGQKVIHYGDFGENIDVFLTSENLEKLQGADFAFVPVGGFYTIDAEQAIELIDKTKPHTAIGMHYRSESYKCGYDNLGTDTDFLTQGMLTCHDVHFGKYSFIDTEEDVILFELMTLMPECCAGNPNRKNKK